MPEPTTAPSTRAPARYVPFAAPALHGPPCRTCDGEGIADRYLMTSVGEDQLPLLIDLFCPDCDGCGNADHSACDPAVHANADPDDEVGEGDPCPSCGGREYAAVQGFPTDGPADDGDMVTLRLPCGLCTTNRTELVELVWRDGQIVDVIREPTGGGNHG